MKNAIQRFGYTCAAAMIAAAFSGIISAQTLNRITVNLPQDVVVGSATLPAGTYDITDIESASGQRLFIFRGENGKPVMVQADAVEERSAPSNTSVILSKDGSRLHLEKLLVEGLPVSYEFGR